MEQTVHFPLILFSPSSQTQLMAALSHCSPAGHSWQILSMMCWLGLLHSQYRFWSFHLEFLGHWLTLAHTPFFIRKPSLQIHSFFPLEYRSDEFSGHFSYRHCEVEWSHTYPTLHVHVSPSGCEFGGQTMQTPLNFIDLSTHTHSLC